MFVATNKYFQRMCNYKTIACESSSLSFDYRVN